MSTKAKIKMPPPKTLAIGGGIVLGLIVTTIVAKKALAGGGRRGYALNYTPAVSPTGSVPPSRSTSSSTTTSTDERSAIRRIQVGLDRIVVGMVGRFATAGTSPPNNLARLSSGCVGGYVYAPAPLTVDNDRLRTAILEHDGVWGSCTAERFDRVAATFTLRKYPPVAPYTNRGTWVEAAQAVEAVAASFPQLP